MHMELQSLSFNFFENLKEILIFWTQNGAQRFGILSHVVKNKPNEEEKTMKKKWLVLCCVGMLSAFAMTGCGSSADTTAPAEETQEVEMTDSQRQRTLQKQKMQLRKRLL